MFENLNFCLSQECTYRSMEYKIFLLLHMSLKALIFPYLMGDSKKVKEGESEFASNCTGIEMGSVA